ncbi:helix-turn-helix domain-containing protein [Streptomyces sp. NRRL F-5135]|uniref:helix-turn-helix domain-containing protein n=1 Tax=Streptomyces sp. NRRL F-5135 TaxID=1463858 RepID=UPI0004CC4F56|nr:helix-turn-helix transcriptional regulator [Streptomyces sp. NRRL F-5135]
MNEDQIEDEDSARAALGSTLRFLRDKAGKSLGQLAEETRYDKSYLYRLETGNRISKRPVMEDLDRYYSSGDLLVRLWKLARMEVFKDQYRAFVRRESTATVMQKYMLVMPGLLQTEGYARAVLSMSPTLHEEEALEEQVTARLGRQEVLQRKPPPSIRVILDESVLRCPVAEPETWEEQLAHLLFSAALPRITLQVLPLRAGLHSLRGGSLSLLWQADGSSVAYLEGNASGQLIEEAEDMEKYRLAYDQVRDLALSPPESVQFIEGVLEEYQR